ncbi:hypothetical protein LN040_16140 [Desulfovibrio subterraneus]|uniref:hypothetical protein n=1 Tax=Desulfovibrio subterraneus TaxID=2718620 RepID=UPI0022B8DC84|nr:hypothetical protein [Desulfovibrio subterraneus]WBF67225.1 hypothetical protein LN040_16140 [Desulfovibrio subterraneus]
MSPFITEGACAGPCFGLRNCGHPAHEQAWNATRGHTRDHTRPDKTNISLQSYAPPMPSGRVAINGIVSTLQTTMQTALQTAKLTVRLTQRLTGLNEETQARVQKPYSFDGMSTMPRSLS